ncbi:uncharacterized protein SPSC_00012 [Sporisorium scitamineum]|nr:uncharacterized protein SPSC_00012 [Sporisorium scitamineum]
MTRTCSASSHLAGPPPEGLGSASQPDLVLEDILNAFATRDTDSAQLWRMNLKIALEPTGLMADRRQTLEQTFTLQEFRTLTETLAKNADRLPPAFVSRIFLPRRSPPVLRTRLDSKVILSNLDKRNLDSSDVADCLRAIFQCAFQADSSRDTFSLARSTVPFNFTDRFYGHGLMLLENHIAVHNSLFPIPEGGSFPTGHVLHSPPPTKAGKDKKGKNNKASKVALKYYSKVLPIIQSSGFGKTRTCVQLSTDYPGMLVCLRQTKPGSEGEARVSFPPQDESVFAYFEKCMVNFIGSEQPITDVQHIRFNDAHLAMLAWLAVYCRTFAFYLAYLKRESPACFSNRRTCTSDPYLCWSTVVFLLADALYTADFIPHRLFKERPMCPNNSNVKIQQPGRDATKASSAKGKRPRPPADDPPPLYGTPSLRTRMLDHICDRAEKLLEEMRKAYADKLNYGDLLLDAIKDHLRKHLDALEQSAPPNVTQGFFFLALDECGSMAELLPVIRRVWFHSAPKRTWILLIDTNSDLAPLAGGTAREGSRRTNHGSTHRLTQPFSAMPLDVNIAHDKRVALFKDRCQLTLREVNLVLPNLGRPLWYDDSYRFDDGTLKPNEIVGKLVLPSTWSWDTKAKQAGADNSEVNQNLLALVSRRINLRVTRGSDFKSWYNFIQNQIAQHLRFVGRIFTFSDAIITNAPSEPPLSAAVAWFFRFDAEEVRNRWSQVILALVHASESVALDMGAKGEQGVAILCTMAADIAVADTFSEDFQRSVIPDANASIFYAALYGLVSVQTWLQVLIGDRVHTVAAESAPAPGDGATPMDVDEDDDIDLVGPQSPGPQGPSDTEDLPDATPDLWGWCSRAFINFKHILLLEEQESMEKVIHQDTLAELWIRHAAAEGVINQPGWDLLIPVYMSDDGRPPADGDRFDKSKLSYIAIQVKNWISRPSKKVRAAPVGPSLSPSAPKECLELFIDINGQTDPLLGHEYSQRRHPAPKEGESAEQNRGRELLRHHIFIAGHDAASFPEIDRLSNPARDQAPLLFGDADSLDTAEFDDEFARYVRKQGNQDAWMEAQVRARGALVSLQPLTAKTSRRRRQSRLH